MCLVIAVNLSGDCKQALILLFQYGDNAIDLTAKVVVIKIMRLKDIRSCLTQSQILDPQHPAWSTRTAPLRFQEGTQLYLKTADIPPRVPSK